MMSKKRPQLRFEGFTDDWEEHKLGDFLKTPEKVKAHIQSKDDLMTLKLNLGGLESGSNRETLELGSTIYYKRKAGQFIYGKQNFFNGSMAIIPIDLDGKATSGDVPSLDVIGILSEYLYVYVSRGDYWKSKESEASGTGSKRIHEKTLQGFDIKVPSTQNEQRKIGSFFAQLDNTIALHQRKLDLLKEQKKGYLQKMFPKNGSKIPELRFAGFADDWEERKLGDEVLIVMGQSPNSENYTDNPNDHILVQGNADMKNGHVFPRVWTTQVTKQAEKNDLILSVRAPVGDIGKTDYDVVIGRGVAAIKGNEFIFQNLGKMKSDGYWTRYSTGSTFESINSSDIKEAIISIPRIEEQQKIGSFFKQLDETIALHQRKLDLLKEQKKGFLQQMFV